MQTQKIVRINDTSFQLSKWLQLQRICTKSIRGNTTR